LLLFKNFQGLRGITEHHIWLELSRIFELTEFVLHSDERGLHGILESRDLDVLDTRQVLHISKHFEEG
jgi:hypothetical protein